MLLSKKTSIKLNASYANILGHMCYAAYKLWNICNYERLHYKELAFPDDITYPDWYYQKSAHKSDFWYKQLPSQTAQEVCKLLDKSWKSFYKLEQTQSINNPRPPYFKHAPIAVTYMQNGIVHENGSDMIRLSISKSLKTHMADTYQIHENYIYLKNKIFKNMNMIKQLKIYPPKNGISELIVIYEIENKSLLGDNGRYLSIDLGCHNLMTCFDSAEHSSFIVGRKYLSICYYFAKKIGHKQSRWYSTQSKHGISHLKGSRAIQKMYIKRKNTIHDYLHKITRYIADYCVDHDIHTVVIGDITNIRKDKDYGKITNQKLHALPYHKLCLMLEYKLAMYGISFVMQKESYTSQCSPLSPEVNRNFARKAGRIYRGLYVENKHHWNADTVGAYNILRLYLTRLSISTTTDPCNLKEPIVIKVAV